MRTNWFRHEDRGCRVGKVLLLGLLVCAAPYGMAQSHLMAQPGPRGGASSSLPDAPVPQRLRDAGQEATPQGRLPTGAPVVSVPCTVGACSTQPLCCGGKGDHFQRYLRSQSYRVYTRRQLAVLAAKNVADPFNLLSVLGSAAIIVGSSSHSIYGPGMPGLARATGVTLTENMTDEFFGTFLIPSLDHQAPGFRRMPNRPILSRLTHCATQVFWTRSQTDRPMFNYANVVGNIAEQGVAVTYVPFRNQGWGPAAERVALNYASDPIGNLINEFVPQVASHINVKVVFFQNIINRVATTVGQPPGM